MLERWRVVIEAIDEFQSFLSLRVPKLVIQTACDRSWSNERYLLERRTGIYRHYGVYLIFDESEALQYVGKALTAFDDRICDKRHDAYRKWTDVI